MTDDDRAQLQRVERLLQDLKRDGERRDSRIELVNGRVIWIGGLLFGFASLAIIGGAWYLISHTDGDIMKIVGLSVVAIAMLVNIRIGAKEFYRDRLTEQQQQEERRLINIQRKEDGLDPIKDPTIWDDVLGLLLLLIVCACFVALVGGIIAIAADLIFYSRTFGPTAQLGAAAAVCGFLGFGLITIVSDWIAKLSNWLSSRRRRPSRDAV